MLRSFLRVGALGAVLTSGVACHLLLDGQDLEGSGAGSSGDGGQGGRGTGTSTSMSAMQTATSDRASSATTASDGGGPQQGLPCTVTDEQNCVVPTDGAELFQFDQLCEHPNWCHYDTAMGTVLNVEDGELHITANPAGTQGNGWWTDAAKQFAPLMFKRVSGDFIILANLSVSGALFTTCPNSSTDFKVGGLLLRDREGMPKSSTERFYKLEYGCLGGTMFGGAGFGTLWAQVDNGSAAHLDVITTASHVDDIGLAICRMGTQTEFFFRAENNWEPMIDSHPGVDPMVVSAQNVAVGLVAGTFNASGETTVAEFEYVGIRTGDAFETGSCADEILSLDDDLADRR